MPKLFTLFSTPVTNAPIYDFVQMAPFLGIIVTLCGLTGQWHPLSLSRHIWSIYWETIWDHDVSCDDSLIIFIKKGRPIKPKELSVVIYFREFCCPPQYLRRYIFFIHNICLLCVKCEMLSIHWHRNTQMTRIHNKSKDYTNFFWWFI